MRRLIKLSDNNNYKCKFAFTLIVALLLFTVSCNKKNDDEVAFETRTLLFDESIIIESLPQGMLDTDNLDAVEVVDLIEYATNWSDFNKFFSPPEKAVEQSDAPNISYWTDVFNDSSLTYWWTYDRNAVTNYWTIEIEWNNGSITPFMEIWEKKDGSSGEIRYNFNWDNFNAHELYWIYNYSISHTGDYSFSWLYQSNISEYSYYLKYNIEVLANGSGSIDEYTLDELFKHAEWDEKGNGSYSLYIDGEVFADYSWTVE